MKFNQLFLYLLLLGVLLPFLSKGQERTLCPTSNYKSVFGEKYTDACKYISTEKWIADTLISCNIDPKFALGIIFPELVRYSTIQDFIELSSLLTLYVQYGANYADFSVGRFQMKPTFAEQLENDAKLVLRETILEKINLSDSPTSRLQRVKRLQSANWQTRYLIWFIKIMDQKYKYKQWCNESDKLQFYAAAYNGGYTNNENCIVWKMKQNLFHTSVFASNVRYNYSDIALEYFKSR